MKIKRRLKKIVAKSTWKSILPILKLFIGSSQYFHYPVIGSALKRLADLESGTRTQGYTLNIHSDVTDLAQGVVVPIDMMKKLVTESSHRAIMNRCLCRSAYACREFPHDHACIFIGKGVQAIVKNGMGRSASVEEAMAHIDRGAELGLIGQALWIEIERLIMGIKRDKGVAHWLEICFCCPCCCGTFKLINSSNIKDIRNRFNSIGWRAFVTAEKCSRCMKCIKQCPVHAISFDAEQIVIDQQKCLGCGFCSRRCPQQAIELKLNTPILGKIEDYFRHGGLTLDL